MGMHNIRYVPKTICKSVLTFFEFRFSFTNQALKVSVCYVEVVHSEWCFYICVFFLLCDYKLKERVLFRKSDLKMILLFLINNSTPDSVFILIPSSIVD